MIKKIISLLSLIIVISNVAKAELIEKTLAVINNEVVLLTDLKKLASRLNKEALVDDLLMFDKNTDRLKKDSKAQLDFLINERVLDSEIKRQNLSVTMDRVDQEIREISKKNKINKEELLAAVKQQGISESEYQDFIKSRIERQSLVEQEITSKIRISDEDVMAFYLSESGKGMTQSFEFGISHIYFSPKNHTPEEALNRAKEAIDQLRKGEKFETLVSKYSDDNSSTDGTLGAFKSGEFAKEFETAVKDIQVGDTTPILKSKNGFHILKLTSKKAVLDPKYEANKEAIKAQLFEKTFKRQLKIWLEQKKEDSFIRINA